MTSFTDRLIEAFDAGLRTATGQSTAQRPSPGSNLPAGTLDETERRHVAGLMRVNHAGEVCAQALYAGQALTSRRPKTRAFLVEAGREEEDHLAWTAERLRELQSRPSVLNPLWYGASFTMGAFMGLGGDRVSLGFVEATEDGVARHLDAHLERLPPSDERSRAIIEQMRADEVRHGSTAESVGGQVFPAPLKAGMQAVARVMTALSYRF